MVQNNFYLNIFKVDLVYLKTEDEYDNIESYCLASSYTVNFSQLKVIVYRMRRF